MVGRMAGAARRPPQTTAKTAASAGLERARPSAITTAAAAAIEMASAKSVKGQPARRTMATPAAPAGAHFGFRHAAASPAHAHGTQARLVRNGTQFEAPQ